MRQERGLTLIEIAIASTIIGILIVGMMTFMSTLSDSTTRHRLSAAMMRNADSAIKQMTGELRSGFVPGDSPNDWQTALNAGDDEIRYVQPLDFDQDGDEVDVNLNTEWGIAREDTTPASYIQFDPDANSPALRYVFVQDRTFSESARGTDINLDGDTADTYDVGALVWRIPAGTWTYFGGGTTAPGDLDIRITGDIVLVGDFDDDGDADPIFQLNGSRLTIDLWVGDVEAEEPVLQHAVTTVDMRNM